MRLVPDTNGVLRSAEPAHPLHARSEAALAARAAAGFVICLLPQVLYEAWVVLTRPPTANGFGKSAADAARVLADVQAKYPVLPDGAGILPAWERLVTTHAVLGKSAHDARLVAAMQEHGVSHLLTFNVAHFQRFPGITIFTP